MKRFHYFEISSTNDYAKEHLKTHDRVIVTADFQSWGRGRNNKFWEGKPGENVYFSYGVKHSKSLVYNNAAAYQAIGALATIDTLRTVAADLDFTLKYPNDVYAKYNGKYNKISGILVEQNFTGEKCTHSIVGIGMNVNQTKFAEELQQNAVSLKILGKNVVIDDLYNLLAKKIQFFEKLEFIQIMQEWTKNLNVINKKIEIKNKPGKWIALKILSDCRLMLYDEVSEQSIIIDNGDSIRYELG